MIAGTARLVVLEDNDEDFDVMKMACSECRRCVQLLCRVIASKPVRGEKGRYAG